MDWTKAKSILIVALLITNCILGGLYYYQYGGRDVAPETEIEATVSLLAGNGIHVDTVIPDKVKRMPVLFVKYDRTDEEKVEEVLRDQRENKDFLPTERNVLKLAGEVLAHSGFTEDTLVFDSIRDEGENGIFVLYKNVYDGIPIEKSGIVCTVKDGRVSDIQRVWLVPLAYGETKQKVIQANVALIQFMSDWVKEYEGQEPEAVHIQDIRLVYWLDSSVSPSDGVAEDTAMPAWKITYNGGLVSYISAYEAH